MKRIVSFNVNGIRSAIKKGFLNWLENEKPDIVCIQELKAKENQIDIENIKNLGYNSYFFSAEKPGYSGVGILSKEIPIEISKGIGVEKFDKEGRLIIAKYDEFEVISAYFPSGSSGDERQKVKMEWLDVFTDFIKEKQKAKTPMVICGDYNICRLWIDIHNPERHLKSSGFLPEERDWFSSFINLGFVDTFREFDKREEKYSWWSYRAGSRQRNKGWRIDYIVVSESLRNKVIKAGIMREIAMSDHSPVYADITKKAPESL